MSLCASFKHISGNSHITGWGKYEALYSVADLISFESKATVLHPMTIH